MTGEDEVAITAVIRAFYSLIKALTGKRIGRSYLNRRVRARFPPPVVTVTRFIAISIVS